MATNLSGISKVYFKLR